MESFRNTKFRKDLQFTLTDIGGCIRKLPQQMRRNIRT